MLLSALDAGGTLQESGGLRFLVSPLVSTAPERRPAQEPVPECLRHTVSPVTGPGRTVLLPVSRRGATARPSPDVPQGGTSRSWPVGRKLGSTPEPALPPLWLPRFGGFTASHAVLSVGRPPVLTWIQARCEQTHSSVTCTCAKGRKAQAGLAYSPTKWLLQVKQIWCQGAFQTPQPGPSLGFERSHTPRPAAGLGPRSPWAAPRRGVHGSFCPIACSGARDLSVIRRVRHSVFITEPCSSEHGDPEKALASRVHLT